MHFGCFLAQRNHNIGRLRKPLIHLQYPGLNFGLQLRTNNKDPNNSNFSRKQRFNSFQLKSFILPLDFLILINFPLFLQNILYFPKTIDMLDTAPPAGRGRGGQGQRGTLGWLLGGLWLTLTPWCFGLLSDLSLVADYCCLFC